MAVLRAFTYFSHLANITEGRHYIRRRAVRGMEQPRAREPGSLAAVFERLAAAGFGIEAIAEVLGRSLVSVLTAHPTEVQRKSQRDAERSIAQLLLERDTLSSERERKRNELLLRARIAQLWQTRLLRYSRLSVHDEIENALGYYQTTFLRQIPQLYAELEEQLGAIDVASLFSHGFLDRWRPRRQSECQRSDADPRPTCRLWRIAPATKTRSVTTSLIAAP